MLRLALEQRANALRSGALATENAERVEADNYRALSALLQRAQVIVKTTGEL